MTERRTAYLDIQDRFSKQDVMLLELKHMIQNHIKEGEDLAPAVRDLVKAWEAANWLINLVKWIGIIAGAIAAVIALLKGHKP